MIGFLHGTITEIHGFFILLEAYGVGYIVKVAPQLVSAIKAGEERALYIHDHVREDAHDLYGFAAWAEKELFERLLSVSGVGPKVALAVMSAGTLEGVRGAILQGDIAALTAVPGVGKKTAQKIVLDLKGQLVDETDLPSADTEALEALVSLGYSHTQAREALKSVSRENNDVAERLRDALRYLAK